LRLWFLTAVTATLATLIALGLAEIGLRAAGRRPWHSRGRESRNPPVLARDPALGWRTRPGVWWFGPYGKEERRVSATIWPDGSRATGPAPAVGRPEVMLIGCSYTMGWAVGDDETWAWKLQELEPRLRITNRGVGGYGTYHALLLLEERLRAGDHPAAVIYGYVFLHDDRNAASANNLLGISMYSLEGMARTPYATLDAAGNVVRHPPIAWPDWPLHDRSVLVSELERTYVELGARQRTRQAFETTNHLVAEMADLCRRNGIAFAMVDLLGPGPTVRPAQLAFMRERDIPVIGCDAATAPELKDGKVHLVPDDGHPDGFVHAWWARCISAGMRRIGMIGPDGTPAHTVVQAAGTSR
jgi:hypothetical protein